MIGELGLINIPPNCASHSVVDIMLLYLKVKLSRQRWSVKTDPDHFLFSLLNKALAGLFFHGGGCF
jgi:hypothetical protein